MFALFILFFLISTINNYVDKEAKIQPSLNYTSLPENNLLQNYSGVVFHFSMTVLILYSFLNPLVLSQDKVHALVNDGFFQFFSTLLIAIVGIINPFSAIESRFQDRFVEFSKTHPNRKLVEWVFRGRNWQLLKSLLCIAIIMYFFYSGFLFLPDLNQGLVSGVIVFFIFMFIFTSIVQLIKNPIVFKKQIVFRVNYLFKSIKKSFLISIVVIVALLILSTAINIETDKIMKFETIGLLIYNVVMTTNEYKILKLKTANDVSSAL